MFIVLWLSFAALCLCFVSWLMFDGFRLLCVALSRYIMHVCHYSTNQCSCKVTGEATCVGQLYLEGFSAQLGSLHLEQYIESLTNIGVHELAHLVRPGIIPVV